MLKKKLFIHIGTHKTGTTALQLLFYKNLNLFARSGIAYPVCQYSGVAHHKLGWVLGLDTWIVKREILDRLKTPKEEWLLLLQSQCDQILISTETLSAATPAQISQIREITQDFQVKIIIYIRRQDNMAGSVLNEVIKTGTWEYNDIEKIPYHLCYIDKIEQWGLLFGRENIMVRPYEKQQFHEGNIFADFLHHVFDMELTGELVLPEKNPNSRLSRDTLEYKRLINHLPISCQDKQVFIEPLRRFSEAENKDEAQIFQEHNILSPAQRLGLIEKYSKCNEKIARDYLGRSDGRLFYDPLPDLSCPWVPYSGLPVEKVGIITRFLLEMMPDRVNSLKTAIVQCMQSGTGRARQAAQILSSGF